MLTASVPMEILLNTLLFYRYGWVTTLIAALLFARNRIGGHPFGLFDGLLVFVLLMPFLIALLTQLGTNLETLLSTFAIRGQWDTILSLIPRYQRSVSRALGQPRAALAAAGWKAKALAKTGRIDEAFAELESLRGQPEIPETDRLLAVVSLQNLTERFEDARDTIDLVLELDPDNIIAWGGLVELEALHLQNPESARLALEQTKTLPNIADMGPLLSYLEAITLTAESRHHEALEHHKTFRSWSGNAPAQNAVAMAMDAASATMQAISLAALGRADESQRCLDDLRNKLHKHKASELERLCDELLARQSDAAPLPA